MTTNHQRGFACVALYHPKNPINVGSALRAAGCYGAAQVVTTGERYRRAPTDVSAAYRRIPLVHVMDLFAAVPFDCVPVAIEIAAGAKSLVDYKHPERAFYVFGPEDGSLPRSVTERCRDVVVIPTLDCMNLGATVNVVLYDRAAKGARA